LDAFTGEVKAYYKVICILPGQTGLIVERMG
jgi:hypothetical protein